MNEDLDVVTPVVVPFQGSLVAHLFYGDNPDDVLKGLPDRSVHIILGIAVEDLKIGLMRVWNPDCGGPGEMDLFRHGCCPQCFRPWQEGFNVLTLENEVMRNCSCPDSDGPVPCMVLDFHAGDGTNAVTVLRAGLHYIGIESRKELLGEACRRIMGGLE